MDISNRVEGTATNLGGKVEEGFGRMTGDSKTQAEGTIDQLKGKAQDLAGQAQDALGRVGDQARQAWSNAPDGLKQRASQVQATAQRNPLITIALIGIAASAVSHLLWGRSDRD